MGVEPPLVGVAVKVTLLPAHTIPAGFAAIFTLAVMMGFTIIAITLEIAGLPAAQGVTLEINLQVTKSPFTNVLLENTAALMPTTFPFTFHWYEGMEPPLTE